MICDEPPVPASPAHDPECADRPARIALADRQSLLIEGSEGGPDIVEQIPHLDHGDLEPNRARQRHVDDRASGADRHRDPASPSIRRATQGDDESGDAGARRPRQRRADARPNDTSCSPAAVPAPSVSRDADAPIRRAADQRLGARSAIRLRKPGGGWRPRSAVPSPPRSPRLARPARALAVDRRRREWFGICAGFLSGAVHLHLRRGAGPAPPRPQGREHESERQNGEMDGSGAFETPYPVLTAMG
jgi:hypothetical protein